MRISLLVLLSMIPLVLSSAPNVNIPISRFHSDLVSINQNGQRCVNVLVGSPAQSLRLIVDTASADLVLFNSSFCQRQGNPGTATRTCFQPLSTDFSQANYDFSRTFKIEYLNDGERLIDNGAQSGSILVNLPINMTGVYTSLQVGRSYLSDNSRSILGYPSVGTLPVNVIISSPDTVYPPNIPYAPFPYLVNSYNSINECDGLIGIGNPLLSRSLTQSINQSINQSTSTAWHDLVQSIQPLVDNQSIDLPILSLDWSTNRMLYGGIDPTWLNELTWADSYKKSSINQLYSTFSIYEFNVCGKNLLSLYDHQSINENQDQPINENQSINQPIESFIDSASSCLSLPSEIYDSLMTWLPVTCTSSDSLKNFTDFLGGANNQPINQPISQTLTPNAIIDEKTRYCWLSVDQTSQLPILSFRVTQSINQSVNHSINQSTNQSDSLIYLPLVDLLISSRSSVSQPPRLCIIRSTSLYSINQSPHIIFGARALKSIQLAFLPHLSRVGLRNIPSVKQSINQSINQSCVLRVSCDGQQKLDFTYNVCILPECSEYFFWSYNSATSKCSINQSFHILLGVFIGVFLIGELAYNEGVIYMAKKIQGIQGMRRTRRMR